MRIKRFTPQREPALQPDRRRRRAARCSTSRTGWTTRSWPRTRPRRSRTLQHDRARGAQQSTAAGSWPASCPTAPPRTGSTARCSTSSTSPTLRTAEEQRARGRGAAARWSPQARATSPSSRLDAQGIVTSWNAGAERIFGYERRRDARRAHCDCIFTPRTGRTACPSASCARPRETGPRRGRALAPAQGRQPLLLQRRHDAAAKAARRRASPRSRAT